jgi:hypothetical protein
LVAPAPELTPGLLGLEQHLLDHIRGIHFRPEPRIRLAPRQESELVKVTLQRAEAASVAHQRPLIRFPQ